MHSGPGRTLFVSSRTIAADLDAARAGTLVAHAMASPASKEGAATFAGIGTVRRAGRSAGSNGGVRGVVGPAGPAGAIADDNPGVGEELLCHSRESSARSSWLRRLRSCSP